MPPYPCIRLIHLFGPIFFCLGWSLLYCRCWHALNLLPLIPSGRVGSLVDRVIRHRDHEYLLDFRIAFFVQRLPASQLALASHRTWNIQYIPHYGILAVGFYWLQPTPLTPCRLLLPVSVSFILVTVYDGCRVDNSANDVVGP